MKQASDAFELKFLSPEIDNGPGFPETRLWIAIILQAIHEYEMWLQRIQSAWMIKGQTINRGYYNTLKSIEREVQHVWFANICELAGVPQATVLQKLAELDRKYFLLNVKFTASPSYMSRYALRKAKRKKHYA